MRSLEAAFLIDVAGTTEVWLVRHGDCYEGMAEGDDPPLSALGQDQAARLAARINRVGAAAVYSSPYRRALETARAIRDNVHVDQRLIEMHIDWSEGGQLELKEPPQGVIERMRAAINDIVAANPGRRVVVVSHGAAIIAYLTDVLQLEPGQLRLLPYYTSVSVVRALGERRMVGGLCDVSHLE